MYDTTPYRKMPEDTIILERNGCIEILQDYRKDSTNV